MKVPRDFLRLTAADFIVRSAYQMGKTPLLPILAASLGATDLFLGLVVSVSTLTGLLLKPLVGLLSDRQGRRRWLLAGTAFFVLMPLVYRFVTSPEQLLLVRVVHGLATAIYGPVTLASIAELRSSGVAERLGWFGLARSGGYIVGPALAGWLLLWHDPVAVYTIIGLVSALALVPVLQVQDGRMPSPATQVPLLRQWRASLRSAGRSSGIWLAGALELAVFVALYALKTFLPVDALAAGTNVALVGLFFSVQEAAHLLARPPGGRLADRVGNGPAIGAGLLLLAAGLRRIAADGRKCAVGTRRSDRQCPGAGFPGDAQSGHASDPGRQSGSGHGPGRHVAKPGQGARPAGRRPVDRRHRFRVTPVATGSLAGNGESACQPRSGAWGQPVSGTFCA